ncbi:MAG: YDG domain-containing protein [bacterium]
MDLCYIADGSSGIKKYSFDGTTWTARGTITGTFFGLVAVANGSGADIYATTGTGAAAANTLVKYTDTAAYNATGSFGSATTLATAASGKAFRGLAFAPVSYTVTYNGNSNTGGSVPTDSTTYAAGASVTVAGNTGTLTRTGYTFSGWNTAANGSGTDYAASATLTINANTTLYAKWTLSNPTITINGSSANITAADLTTTYGNASANQTFTIAGTNLTADISATAGTGFEVSSNGTSYGSTATFTQSSGSAIGTLYARLAANASATATYTSATMATLSSANATSWVVSTDSAGSAVSTRSLTITANNTTKVYNNALTSSASGSTAFTSSGLQNSETIGSVTITYAGGYNATDSAGTYYITPSAATGGTFTASNYALTYANGTLTVTAIMPSAPTISSITAGDQQLSVAFTAPASNGGASITNYEYSTNGGSSWTTPSPAVTTSPLVITGLTNGVTYDVQLRAVNSAGSGTATANSTGTPVAPASPTISTSGSLSAISTTYGTASSNTSFTVSGAAMEAGILVTPPAGFEVSTDGTTYSSTANVGTSGTISSTTIYVRLAATTAVGTYSGNIALTSANATTQNVATASSTVSAKSLTITGLSAADKTYDGSATVSVTGTAAFSGLVNGESFTPSGSVTWAFPDANAGSNKSLTRTGNYSAPSANYSLTQPTLTANITARAITITASAQSKTYGSTSATSGTLTTDFTLSSGTLQGSDAISGATLSYSGSPAGNLATASPGTYTITPSALTLSSGSTSNYAITYATGTLTISKANQSITFGALSAKTFGDAAFALTATASSGLGVTYTSSNTSVATIAGSTVTIVGAGNTTITAAQAGNSNYSSAADVAQTLVVNKATPTLTFNSANNTAIGGTVTLTATSSAASGSVSASTGAITFTTSNSSIASIASGVATGVAAGSVTLTASQAADSNYNQATQTQTFTVFAGPTTLAAGDILFLQYDADNPDKCTFVTMVDLNPGTVINFTDNGFSSSTTGYTGEGFLIFTVPAGTIYAAGTTFTWINGMTITGTPWSSAAPTSFAFNSSGDQLFAFQGNTADWATQSGITLVAGLIQRTTWLTTGTAAAATSYQPSGLASAYIVSLATENGYFANGTSTTSSVSLSGSKASLQALFADGTNKWYNNATGPLTTPTYSMTITQSQSITFGALSPVTYGDSPFSLNATASSGLAVSYTSSNASVATVAANGTLTIVGSGNTTIMVSQAGNATYSAAANVTQSLTVNQKSLSIIGLTGVNKAYDGLTTASATGTAAVSGLVGSDTVTLGGTPSYSFSSAAAGSSKSITTTGYTIAGGQSSFYLLTQPTLSADITTRALTITAQNVTKPFGTTLTGGSGSTAFNSSGLQNGETIGSVTISYGTGAGSSDAAGTYSGAITPSSATGGTFTESNYSIFYVSGNITVSASPTISSPGSLSAVSTTYGTATASPTSISVSGNNLTGDLSVSVSSGFQISSDGTNYSSGPLTLSATGGTVGSTTIFVRLPATASVGSSPYSGNLSISGGGATPASVAIPGSTVTAKNLTINGITISDKVYDRTTTATINGTAAYSGLANGESFSVTDTPSASFANSAVGTNKTVTVSGYTAPSANYSISQPTGLTANITAKALTVAGAAVTSKAYDATTAATITGNLSGVITGDTVSLSGSGSFASANAGTGISVTSNSTLSGADASNYSLIQPTGLTGDITKANQTITFGALASKTTMDAAFALSATASSGLAVSYSSSNSSVASVAGGTVTIVGAGSTTITASQPGDGNYNAATSVNQTLMVTVGPTTLAIGDIAIIGLNSNTPDGFAFVTWVDLGPNTVIKFTDNGFLSSNSATSTNNGRGGENFVTWTNNTGSVIAAGTVITIIDGTPATTSQGSISQTLNGIANSGDQIFAYQGAGVGNSTSNSDFGTNVNPSTFTGTILFGLNFGGDWLSTGTPTSNTSYRPSELATTYGSLALTTSSTSRGQYTGARSGLTLAQMKAAVVNSANWTTSTGTGVISLDTMAFTIAQSQSITFGALSAVTYGDSSFALSANATSGLAVTYSSSNTSVATVAGSTVTIVGAGSTTITASQAGNANYSAAANVTQSLTVNQKALTGSFAANNKSYDGATSATVASRAVSGKVGTDDVNHTGGTATFSDAVVGNGKTVTLAGAGLSGAAAANYSLASVSTTTANITAAPLTITGLLIADKTYDGTTSATLSGTAAYSGLVLGESFTVNGTPSASFNTAAAGTGKPVTVSGYTAPNGNYSLTQPSLTGTITQAATTINTPPKASTITSGQALSNSILSGGTASVAGTFAFTSPATVPPPGVASQGVTFTPTNGNYSTQTTSVSVGVLCSAPALTRATSPAAGGFTVNWVAVTGAGNYTVVHSASKNMTSATSVDTSSTSLALTGLSDGLRYVQVRANNAAGASANSTQQVNQLQSIAAGATSYLSVPGEVGTNTVAGIFGAANEAGLAAGTVSGNATNILLLNEDGATANTIFYNSNVNQWREGASDMGHATITQGKAFMLKNNSGATDYFLLVGTPRTTQPTVSINAAGKLTLLTTGRTAPTTLADMNLNPGSGAGAFKAASKAKDADKVIVVDPSTGAATSYYHHPTHGWLDGLRPATSVAIPAGQGFFIKKATDSTFTDWTLPAE